MIKYSSIGYVLHHRTNYLNLQAKSTDDTEEKTRTRLSQSMLDARNITLVRTHHLGKVRLRHMLTLAGITDYLPHTISVCFTPKLLTFRRTLLAILLIKNSIKAAYSLISFRHNTPF